VRIEHFLFLNSQFSYQFAIKNGVLRICFKPGRFTIIWKFSVSVLSFGAFQAV